MTHPAAPASATSFVPTGNPVRRFVAGVAAVAAVFIGLWWTGLVAPRVAVAVDERFDAGTNQGEAIVTARNEGMLAATVDPPDVRDLWSEPGGDNVIVRSTGVQPDREVRVAGGDEVTFTIRFAVDCERYHRTVFTPRGTAAPALHIRLRAEGPLGGDRRAVSFTEFERACRPGALR